MGGVVEVVSLLSLRLKKDLEQTKENKHAHQEQIKQALQKYESIDQNIQSRLEERKKRNLCAFDLRRFSCLSE